MCENTMVLLLFVFEKFTIWCKKWCLGFWKISYKMTILIWFVKICVLEDQDRRKTNIKTWKIWDDRLDNKSRVGLKILSNSWSSKVQISKWKKDGWQFCLNVQMPNKCKCRETENWCVFRNISCITINSLTLQLTNFCNSLIYRRLHIRFWKNLNRQNRKIVATFARRLPVRNKTMAPNR